MVSNPECVVVCCVVFVFVLLYTPSLSGLKLRVAIGAISGGSFSVAVLTHDTIIFVWCVNIYINKYQDLFFLH